MRILLVLLFSLSIVQPSNAESSKAESVFGDIPGEFSGGLRLASDYIFRGISLTSNGNSFAAQPWVTYTHPSGVYVTAWTSTIDLDKQSTLNKEGTVEMTYYLGKKGTVLQDVSYDVGAYYATFPGNDETAAGVDLDYDYADFYGSLTKPLGESFVGTVGFAYSPDYFNGSGDGYYGWLDLTAKLPFWGASIAGHVARQEIEDNAAFGFSDYNEWGVGLNVPLVNHLALGLNYRNTDEDRQALTGEHLVVSVTASF
jgi:uncharacterized protein (TIGR02001 family)